ncbi:MAG: tetratricopeptide repeat protein [Thermodesulfobacteriota bacterium]|nr:tetratricopeptide repeat protein [Thermodesulfobacteriota bacterium]
MKLEIGNLKLNSDNYQKCPIHIYIAVIFLSLFAFHAHASMELIVDEEKQLSFAEQYFKDGEYKRAIGEYERFVYFFPESDKIEFTRYKIGLSYMKNEQYDQAVNTFFSIIEDYRDTKYAFNSYIEISRVYLLKKAYSKALINLNNLIMIAADQATIDGAYYEKAWVYMEMGLWEKATDCLKKVSLKNQGRYNIKETLNGLDKKNHIKRKNPTVAGFLSVVPGAGHLYCERGKDALISFILNGAMIFAAYEAFDKDLNGIGGVISFLELGFYSGNIYSAVSSAHKYNRGEQRRFLDYIKKGKRISISMDNPEENKSVLILCQFPF